MYTRAGRPYEILSGLAASRAHRGPADSVGPKRINEYTAESTLIHAGKEIARTTRVVSEDRKTMTITYKGLDPEGNDVNYTLVFDRVP